MVREPVQTHFDHSNERKSLEVHERNKECNERPAAGVFPE